MEIHQHAHTPRKKWAHYLWEFLMLFLAVFCGFLAELQLEHTIEHQREKQLVTTLIHDLENDMVNFSRSIMVFAENASKFDSAKKIIRDPVTQNDVLEFYKAATVTQNFSSFNYSDRTVEQLRDGGNFRLIRNAKVSDSLIEYDRYIRHTYLAIEKILEQHSLRLQDMINEFVDYDAYNFLLKYNWNKRQSLKTESIPFPLTLQHLSKMKFSYYYNSFGLYRNWCKRMVEHSAGTKEFAARLITLIKKEYHFD